MSFSWDFKAIGQWADHKTHFYGPLQPANLKNCLNESSDPCKNNYFNQIEVILEKKESNIIGNICFLSLPQSEHKISKFCDYIYIYMYKIKDKKLASSSSWRDSFFCHVNCLPQLSCVITYYLINLVKKFQKETPKEKKTRKRLDLIYL